MTALPDSIIQNGLFCCWKYEERNGRKTKVPYQPETGLGAKSNDPSSFVPYKTAVQASGYDGIGIGIFNGICAIDLDNCVSDSGYYTQTAAEIVALMHSYTEYSPSGNGLHILFSAKGFQYDTKRFYIMNHQAGIEVYVAGATNKYVTVTGNRCGDYEYGDRTQELQTLLDKFMRRPEVSTENAINAKNSDLSTKQLLQLAKSSKNGAAFTALWNGSLEGYSSPSEADLALCSHLAFWTGRDAAKMDTMFRQSGLMRDKWDRQQSGTTYGATTIQKAIEHCREIYTPKAEPSPVFQPIVPLTPQWSDLPAFPVDALPDVIRNYVSAVAEHSQTAPDMAAVISLGVLATCLQGKYKIEGTPGYCKIFPNEEFMYKEYAVYQPLQRRGVLDAESIERLRTSSYFTSNSSIFNETDFEQLKEMNPRSAADEKKYQKYLAGQQFVADVLTILESNRSDHVFMDYGEFEKHLKSLLGKVEGMSASRLTGIAMVLAVMDKTAVVQKDRKGEIIKDTTTKDTEIIKLTQDPEKYFEAEVYPHVPDAIWAYEFDPEKKESATNKEKLGAEFPFTRFFYEYKEPKKANDLLAQFMELEKSLSEKIVVLQESEGV